MSLSEPGAAPISGCQAVSQALLQIVGGDKLIIPFC